jgi:ABC-type antimicrobial peptide transport system permease subunit
MTVVGVVGDTRSEGITEPVPGTMYVPHQQAGATSYFTSQVMGLVVSLETGVPAPVTAIRQALNELDRNIPLSDVRLMHEVVAGTIATQRFTTTVMGVLAVLAVGLAAIGLYGIIAYGVTQRRREFGVRIALGAGSTRVMGIVLREGLLLAGGGLMVGMAGALALDRLLRSILADVVGIDMRTLYEVSIVLVLVACLATMIPARRALAVDPAETLRAE